MSKNQKPFPRTPVSVPEILHSSVAPGQRKDSQLLPITFAGGQHYGAIPGPGWRPTSRSCPPSRSPPAPACGAPSASGRAHRRTRSLPPPVRRPPRPPQPFPERPQTIRESESCGRIRGGPLDHFLQRQPQMKRLRQSGRQIENPSARTLWILLKGPTGEGGSRPGVWLPIGIIECVALDGRCRAGSVRCRPAVLPGCFCRLIVASGPGSIWPLTLDQEWASLIKITHLEVESWVTR